MWLRAARKQFFIRGVTAFLAVIVCGGAFDWGHAGGDDPDCNVVVVAHNHSAHHFAAATSTSPAADQA